MKPLTKKKVSEEINAALLQVFSAYGKVQSGQMEKVIKKSGKAIAGRFVKAVRKAGKAKSKTKTKTKSSKANPDKKVTASRRRVKSKTVR
jgi:hypothetical protein